jgi:hypothetical protein
MHISDLFVGDAKMWFTHYDEKFLLRQLKLFPRAESVILEGASSWHTNCLDTVSTPR